MINITKAQAIEGLSKVFNSHSNTRISEGKIYVNKKDLTREQAIAEAIKYFEDKNIIDGQCKVSPITFVWTVFSIEDLSAKVIES